MEKVTTIPEIIQRVYSDTNEGKRAIASMEKLDRADLAFTDALIFYALVYILFKFGLAQEDTNEVARLVARLKNRRQ